MSVMDLARRAQVEPLNHDAHGRILLGVIFTLRLVSDIFQGYRRIILLVIIPHSYCLRTEVMTMVLPQSSAQTSDHCKWKGDKE